MPKFESVITLGTVLQAVTLLMTVIHVGNQIRMSVVRLEEKHEMAMKDIGLIRSDIYELRAKIVDGLEKRVRDLEVALGRAKL